MKSITATANARAGLLGNPSDVYGGRAIAFTFSDFQARALLGPAERFEISWGDKPVFDADSAEAARGADPRDHEGAAALVLAAIKRLDLHLENRGGEAARNKIFSRPFRLDLSSNIPRQVGLAGSSAIIVAALRAFARAMDVALDPADLAEIALEAETCELGITAGPMDRVAQAYDGLVYIDCKPPRSAASYRRLDPSFLPPMFIAWNPEVGESSGGLHDAVRRRWEAGDSEVHEAMARFPRLADQGLICLESGDRAGLLRLVDRNFDTRAAIWPLRDVDRRMVEIGRRAGAAVKFCGSGGAVLGVMKDQSAFTKIEHAYREAGFPVIQPKLTAPSFGSAVK